MKFYEIEWELIDGGTWTVGLTTMSFETAVKWALGNKPPVPARSLRTVREVTAYDSIEIIGVD